MEILPLLLKEMAQEAETTRKMLKLVQANHFDYRPHEKSMLMKHLAVHIAELPSWPKLGLESTELDFAANSYAPTEVGNNEELLALFEKSYQEGKAALEKASEKDLLPNWTLRMGEKVLASFTKYEMIRHSFSQIIHHRAQLGVYLRLLNIPIPGSYGPSADDHEF
ncbi:MAG: DinB family protein [Ginsengibacter sp.]